MDLVPTEEQRELRDMLRCFFADKSSSARVRELMASPSGYDTEVWTQMADQLGLQAMAVPEEYGGAGFGVREVAVVMEEMGRALVCAPYLSSAVLGATVLLASRDEDARREHLPAIAAGTTLATLAWTEGTGWDPASTAMTARPSGDGWVLDGTKTHVLDGHVADLILVTARAGRELALFAVDGTAPGLTRTALKALDQTRRLARLDLDGVPARRIEADAPEALARTLDVAAVALAAEQLGGAEKVMAETVAYAKVREQFGRPIGGFQAIKHRCADMFVQVESARSAVLQAAAVADSDPAALPAAAALAKAYCSDAYFAIAGEGIQIHGGIGFTWEHDAHLHFKRARSSQELLGPPALHRRRLADLVGVHP